MNIKLLSENAKIPTRGSEEAAGWDLYAAEDFYIKPSESAKVPTDIAIELPMNTCGCIFPRSGLATKKGLRLCNCVGLIDSDYRGNVIVPLYNDSCETRYVVKHERIAQLVVMPYIPVDMNPVDELSDTKRGEGGFGSTGAK